LLEHARGGTEREGKSVTNLFGMELKRRLTMLRGRMPRRSLRQIAEEHDLLSPT
jgi:hypothetical protein